MKLTELVTNSEITGLPSDKIQRLRTNHVYRDFFFLKTIESLIEGHTYFDIQTKVPKIIIEKENKNCK